MTGAFNNVLRMRQQAAAAIDTPSEDSEQRAREEDQVAHMVDAERRRFLLRRLPEKVCEPRTVRFGFPRIGEQRNGHVVSKVDDEETKFVFDIAFAGECYKWFRVEGPSFRVHCSTRHYIAFPTKGGTAVRLL